ncbi:Ubiquitin Carboxyl-Terminal Hydrolase 31 [Manis pentadactyla]|nr:Ubiquitin Carboxyl-Terminal Hydrolase 31 [Manis pentadactyla]
MMPAGRKHLEKAEKASREAEDMAACDPGMQEWRELMGLEEGPEEVCFCLCRECHHPGSVFVPSRVPSSI